MKVSSHKEEPLKEEIFGPIIPIVTFLNEKELIELRIKYLNEIYITVLSL